MAASRLRMGNEERREQLLRAGVELLGRRPYGEISIEEIAEAAGVAKGLLYHHFPSKDEFIAAALEREQRQLAERLSPDSSLPAGKRAEAALKVFLDCIEARPNALASTSCGRGESPEIAAAFKSGRAEQLASLIEALLEWEEPPVSINPGPALETALQGWLFFCEGAKLRRRGQDRLDGEELRALLRSALDGALFAAAAAE